MFGQLKDIYNLKKQAEEMQRQLAQEKFTATSGLVTLTIDGNQNLLEVRISKDQALEPTTLERDFKSAFRSAQDQMKTKLAEKFRGMV